MALRRGTTLIGFQVVGAQHRAEPFRPVDWRIAEGIAQIASVALEHARVVEELNQASRLSRVWIPLRGVARSQRRETNGRSCGAPSDPALIPL